MTGREMTAEELAAVRRDVGRWVDEAARVKSHDPRRDWLVLGERHARDLIAHVDALTAKLATAERALAKISTIRDSIVGHQRVGISEHIYPLVAALEEAGVHGIGYAAARDEATTMHGRIAAAETRADAAEAKLRALVEAWDAVVEANAAWSATGPQAARDLAPVLKLVASRYRTKKVFQAAIEAARGGE